MSPPTLWITAYFFYAKPKEPVVATPEPQKATTTLERAAAATMVWLWHDRVPAEYGDVTDKEVAILWRRFQAEPRADDIAVNMMRRRVTMLWRDYLTTN
jgi:hypothetical protein